MERTDVDDFAVVLLEHDLADLTGKVEQTIDVGRHHGLPLLVGVVHRRCNDTGCSIVDEDVDSAEFLLGGLNSSLDLLGLGDVAGSDDALYAVLVNLFLDFLKLFDAACADHDICALLCKADRKLSAQTRGCAGDDRILAFDTEVLFHIFSLLKLSAPQNGSSDLKQT